VSIQSTDGLDVPNRALPAVYVYNVSSGPNVDTSTMDIASRGLPAIFIYAKTGSSASASPSAVCRASARRA
jgi:hypothetical protein